MSGLWKSSLHVLLPYAGLASSTAAISWLAGLRTWDQVGMGLMLAGVVGLATSVIAILCTTQHTADRGQPGRPPLCLSAERERAIAKRLTLIVLAAGMLLLLSGFALL